MSADLADNDLDWVCAIPKPQTEFKTAAELQDLGFSAFVPMTVKVRRVHRKHKKTALVPYPAMPGYVFVGVQKRQNRWPEINNVETVVKALSFNGAPARLRHQDIARLRAIEAENTPHTVSVSTHKAFAVGDRVAVPAWDTGALVLSLLGGDKAKVRLDAPLLGKVDVVDIALECLERAA